MASDGSRDRQNLESQQTVFVGELIHIQMYMYMYVHVLYMYMYCTCMYMCVVDTSA